MTKRYTRQDIIEMFLIECAHAAAFTVVVVGELLALTGILVGISALVNLFH